jgi:hypothetical protein
MRHLAHAMFAVFLPLAAPACGIDDDFEDLDGDGKADGAGTNGSIGYIQSNSPFYWADSTYVAYAEVANAIGLGNTDAIADDSALVARLQLWADRLDRMVRDELVHSGKIDLVAPRPIIKVLPRGGTFNAWVSPAIACAAPAPATGDGIIKFLRDTSVGSYLAPCLRPGWPDDRAPLRAFWNAPKPACRINEDDSISGSGCNVAGDQGELSLIATSPYIHFTSDLLAGASERTMVVVLAHELAHYYRSHTSDAKLAKYNFWYDTELDRKKRPVPAVNAADLERKYREIVAGPISLQAMVTGRYSARLRSFLITSISEVLVERVEPGFACAAARDALGPWVDAVRGSSGAPSPEIDSYLAFESALAACAPALALNGTPSASSVSYGKVIMAIMQHARLGTVTLPFRATLADVLADVLARMRA